MGTRVAFLESIINWVNNPTSERGLVLLGQAGTGESRSRMRSHDCSTKFTALRHRLSWEQPERKAFYLFTTLARDLVDRYSSYKITLGKVVRDNTPFGSALATRIYCLNPLS